MSSPAGPRYVGRGSVLAGERYQTILPSDEVLYAAFRARLAKEPGAFAGWQRQICLADKEDLLTITCVSAR